MTPEQKQVEQIQERQRQRRLSNFHYDVAVAVRDIDFLLSLVKSQGQLLERVPLAQSALTQLDELRAANKRAAASMRSACVEKVKAMRDRWDHNRNIGPARETSTKSVKILAANDIITELESLSIEQPKE